LRNLARPRSPKRRELPDALWNQYGLDQWATSEAVRNGWLQLGCRQMQAFLDQFVEVLELLLWGTTWTRALAIMRQYDLKSYDALHVATALESGLQDFASADREFDVGLPLTLWLARDDRPPLV
jgi:predicted nucleic acid-binding protein